MDIEFAKAILTISESTPPFCILRINGELKICSTIDKTFNSVEQIEPNLLVTGFQNYDGDSGRWFSWQKIENVISTHKSIENNRELKSVSGSWDTSIDRDEFITKVSLMKQDMNKGKYFLANLTRQTYTYEKNDFLFACFLSCIYHETPFRFLLYLEDEIILGLSPERFIRIENKFVLNQPMKGTSHSSDELINDLKEINENTMMIDLARSDLSQICEPETISLQSRNEISRHPNLFQMSSSIFGKLSENILMTDAINSILPVSSVTGTPKPYVVKRLSEIEEVPRNEYCGIYGWINTKENSCDLAVTIRTIINKNEKTSIGVGSGITIESNENKEWEETQLKAQQLIKLVENSQFENNNEVFTSLRVTKDKKTFCLDQHLIRLCRHSKAIGITVNLDELTRSAIEFINANIFNDDSYLKIISSKSEIRFEIGRFEQKENFVELAITLAPDFGNKEIPKYKNRNAYELCLEISHILSNQSVDDAILIRDNFITETTRSNLLFRKGNELFMCDSNMINGIAIDMVSKNLLDAGYEIEKKKLSIDFLYEADEIISFNSVRGPLLVSKIISPFLKENIVFPKESGLLNLCINTFNSLFTHQNANV